MKRTAIYAGIVLALLLAATNRQAIAEKIQGWFDLAEQSTIANPASGYRRLAFKTDGKLYARSSAGTETEIGAGGGSSFDCTAAGNLCLSEEFMGGGTTTGSPVGNHALRNVAMGSGGILYGDGEDNHIGNIRLDSSSTSSSGIWLGFAASGGNGSARMVNWYSLYNNDWDLTWGAKLTSVANIRFRAGFDNAMSYGGSLTSASMWIRYDTASPFADNTKASGAGAWVAQICGYDDSGSNCTASDTAGLTAQLAGTPDTNWHQFHIYRTGGKIYFQVDSGATKTACLAAGGCDMTLPPNPGSGLANYVTTPAIIWTAEATGSKSAYVDYAKFKMSGLTR